jgi:hypothetical protein
MIAKARLNERGVRSDRVSAIEDIEDRMQDLIEALRETGAPDVAEMLERYANDFTDPTVVRRSVNAVSMHLERWRLDPSGLPDSPKVMLAANRLEDVCREALAAGVIAPAPPTLAAQSRRKLLIVLGTLIAASLVTLAALGVVASGVDVQDLGERRSLPPAGLPRGEESSAALNALAEALVPKAVTGVEFEPVGGCKVALPDGATCAEVPPRLWAEGRLPTYEIKLARQAYGLLFAVADARVEQHRFGTARLLLAATDDTPEGRYELPFVATYLGYTPQRCEPLQRIQGDCPPPRTGQGEKHAGLSVPTVVIDVLPGDPSRRMGEKRRAQAEAAEQQKKAQERAQQIATAVTEIKAVLDDTQKLIAKKKWSEARANVDKLGALFEPLDGVALDTIEGTPSDVALVRDRLDKLRAEMDAFEQRVFEQTFKIVSADSNKKVAEESLLVRIGKQFAIAPAYVERIYTSRADEIQRRLDQRAQARLEQLKVEQEAREKRCGPLPKDAWHTVDRYVHQVYAEPHTEIVLGECMTPRLTERDCWEMRCEYERKVEVAIERPKVVTHHEATFYLINDRVARHTDG